MNISMKQNELHELIETIATIAEHRVYKKISMAIAELQKKEIKCDEDSSRKLTSDEILMCLAHTLDKLADSLIKKESKHAGNKD